jgi:hypothetical protein
MIEATNTPVFYDCEASCIGGLPIEVGWAFVDPSVGDIRKRPANRAWFARADDRYDRSVSVKGRG